MFPASSSSIVSRKAMGCKIEFIVEGAPHTDAAGQRLNSSGLEPRFVLWLINTFRGYGTLATQDSDARLRQLTEQLTQPQAMRARGCLARASQLALLAANARGRVTAHRDGTVVLACLATIANRVIGPPSRHQHDIAKALIKKKQMWRMQRAAGIGINR